MPDDNSDKVWDEYDWERFLQQQEQRTERYMELLEKYLDHPQRDEIIAREMGWDHLLDSEEDEDWEDEVDASFEQEMGDFDGDEDDDSEDDEDGEMEIGCERDPLYQQAIAFASELDESFESLPKPIQEHPATVSLISQTTLATAKLAAALSDNDLEELGMSIAYLKRALHAINCGLTSAKQLADGGTITSPFAEKVFRRLFAIREGIVDQMGAYRTEFRRRHGQ